jgi:serine/threonine-protein kinase RsbW
MVRQKFQVTRAAELESLAFFRDFIKSICKQHVQIDAEACYDLQLAVDEACTNVIEHGYAGMNPGSIILGLDVTAGQVCVTITDFGHPFEPSEAPKPDVKAGLEERPTGGFGLYFIYQTMDEVDYETTEAGNRLYFIKKLHRPA